MRLKDQRKEKDEEILSFSFQVKRKGAKEKQSVKTKLGTFCTKHAQTAGVLCKFRWTGKGDAETERILKTAKRAKEMARFVPNVFLLPFSLLGLFFATFFSTEKKVDVLFLQNVLLLPFPTLELSSFS